MDFATISWLGVLIAAVALFILAAVWFTALFGKAYRKELGVEEGSPTTGLGKALVGQFITSVVMTIAIALFVGTSSAGVGALVGLVAGVLVAAALTQLYQFEGKSITHLLINVGYFLVGLTGVGAILGAFQGA